MLAGLRVLDLCAEPGLLAGKILADLGADVIVVEPPGGHPLRRRGPFLGGVEDPERSLPWLALNTSKRSVVLDRERDRDAFRRLVATADAVLETGGTDPAPFRSASPRLVWCSITPFGRTGPRAGWRGCDLVVVAMGGNASATGDPDRPPVRCTMPTGHYHACAEAALGVVMAVYARETSGQGTIVDVSTQECQLQTLLSFPGQHALSGELSTRQGPRIGRTREIWPAADGFVTFGLRGGPARAGNLAAAVALMHEHGAAPDWLRAVDWDRYDHNAQTDEELARLEEAFGAFFRRRTMRWLYGEALRRRILLAPCNDAREIAAQPQLRARGLFTTLDYPELGATLEHPAFFALSTAGETCVRGRAPRIDEHGAEIRAGLAPERAIAPDGDAPRVEPGGVFEGLRVLELGSGAAGPVASRYLVEQGARVVRIESSVRPDFLRLLRLRPGMPQGVNAAPMFVLLNPGKESVAVNLKTREGVALVKRLTAWADVVIENHAPGVMEKLGLRWEALCAANPQLVVVQSSLFGQTGPERAYPGFGGQASAIAGFNHLTGWPDREALGPFGTITDSLAPRFVALVTAAALWRRHRGGGGGRLDVSQIECGVYCLSEMLVRFSATGERVARRGNRDETAVPHGVFPCRGDDRFIAIAIWSDAEWRELARALGIADDRFDTAAGRRAHEEALEARISDATRPLDAFALMDALQSMGLHAGVVQNEADLLADPQLAHRDHFVTLHHRHLGALRFERTGFRLEGSPPRLDRPAPDLGEHTEPVLRELLGLDAGEVRRLVEADVLV